jgi:hypothetical protein
MVTYTHMDAPTFRQKHNGSLSHIRKTRQTCPTPHTHTSLRVTCACMCVCFSLSLSLSLSIYLSLSLSLSEYLLPFCVFLFCKVHGQPSILHHHTGRDSMYGSTCFFLASRGPKPQTSRNNASGLPRYFTFRRFPGTPKNAKGGACSMKACGPSFPTLRSLLGGKKMLAWPLFRSTCVFLLA